MGRLYSLTIPGLIPNPKKFIPQHEITLENQTITAVSVYTT